MKRKNKETVDKKAREVIMQIANQLYGNTIAIKGLADKLFPPRKKRTKE